MKSEYKETRFLTQNPTGVPDYFGIVTAFNPDGVMATDEQNRKATEELRAELAARGFHFFPVTGCSPDLHHQEPGFGIESRDREEIVALGRKWHQEAVFWVERGMVHLLPCGEGERVCLGEWIALIAADQAER